MNKILVKVLKWSAWIVAGLILLLLLLTAALQIPYVQNKVKDEALAFIQEKIGTPVHMDQIAISFPKKIVFKGLYIESKQQDTLLYTSYLGVDINLLQLIKSKVVVDDIELEGLKARITKDENQVYNFDYIIDAFATTDADKPDESGTLDIRLGNIRLNALDIEYRDAYDGHQVKFKLNEFQTRIKNFELEPLAVTIPKLMLDGVELQYERQQTPFNQVEKVATVSEVESELALPKLEIGTIQLTHLDITYLDAVEEMFAALKLGNLEVNFQEIDLNNQVVAIDHFALSNTQVAAQLFQKDWVEKTDPIVEPDTIVATPADNWKIAWNDLDLKGISIQYDNDNVAPTNQGLDFNHLNFKEIQMRLLDFKMGDETFSGNLESMAVKEKSGLDIQNFKTFFLYGEQTAFLKDFLLETPNTKIKTEVILRYEDLKTLTENYGEVAMEVQIQDSHIGIQDVLLIQPDLITQLPIRAYKDGALHLDMASKGLLRDFQIDRGLVYGLGGTRLSLTGAIKGLPDMNRAHFDLKLEDFRTTAKDLSMFIPKGTLPDVLKLPSAFSLNGNFKGGLNQFHTQLKLKSTAGQVELVASLDQKIKNKEKYQVHLKTEALALGSLISNDSIGNLSMTIEASGQGFDLPKLNASAVAHVASAVYAGYVYEDLELKALVEEGHYEVQTQMSDPNLNFDLSASGQLGEERSSLKLDANFNKVDLQALHIQEEPFAFLGVVHADLNSINPDDLDGTVRIHDFAFAESDQVYALDTIQLKATSEPHIKRMVLNSELLDAVVEGDYKLTELADKLVQSLAHYFAIGGEKDVPEEPKSETEVALEEQHMHFFVSLKEHDMFYRMVPELKELKPIYLEGDYKTQDQYFMMHGELAAVQYGGFKLSNIVFDMESKANSLSYYLDVARFENENLAINKMALLGTVGDNVLTYDLDLKDGQDRIRYKISGSLTSMDDFMEIKLDPEGFLLNYESWEVNPENVIQFGEKGLYAQAFELNQKESSIRLHSLENYFGAPLHMDFKDFDIETLTQMIKQDYVLVSGRLDGEVLLKDLNKTPYFESDLKIRELALLGVPMGDLNIKVMNETATSVAAEVQLQSDANQIKVSGRVDIETSTMDLKLDLDRLAMQTLEAFSFDNLKESEGFLSGHMVLRGAFTKPDIRGNFLFHDVGFKVRELDASFIDINETIKFTNRGIEFDNFTISDTDKNVLVLDGQIATKNYQDFSFNLDIKSEDFKAINSTVKDNDLYYGDLLLDTNLKIRGDLDKPIVSGVIGIDKGTDFVFIMPQSDPSIADREGIVEFVDETDLRLKQALQLEEEFNSSKLKGLDVAVAIQIDKEAQFTIVIDQANGDKITIQGEGDLMGGIDPSGKTTLTGRYEFEKGAYAMSFNFIRKRFEVEKGSSIIWTGDPTAATLDLIAVYGVNAPPIDLLQNQLGDLSPMEANMYKQKIPIKTLLKMKGELMKPEISFDIQIPDGNLGVSGDVVSNTKTKLDQLRQQESELNKQVFALILLNRFVGENPFESMAGGMTAESIARQSVSKILSDQMNNLAGNLIAGIELDFNLESIEDYSSGERENRTDLNIGVSKRMLDDRLKVTIGSSFGLEGSERENEQSTNIAGDITAEYMLSKDGRYMLRAYRKDEYQVALQGQVVETGVGFVITMSYEKFKEIFERRREKKELREQIKAEKKE